MPDHVQTILRGNYLPYAAEKKHIYLIGNLQRPVPYAYFPDRRVEMVLCFYKRGDDGELHWHPNVTEFEYIIEGCMRYYSVCEGAEKLLQAGDIICIPAGVCVRRRVSVCVRTLTVKVPSEDTKIICRCCSRICADRVEEESVK
ncbi:MAG: cupin domain-containing protein [Verrucomicrobia bacterium]|nr:cupin domain-containing protein [Verrucomicrobiota bacterium]